MRKSLYINITGNIGSGTTTLCNRLCDFFSWTPSFSQAHNSPFLEDLYGTKNFAFQNQVYVLVQSLKINNRLDFSTNSVCQDFCMHEHNDVYSKVMLELGYLTCTEYDILVDMWSIFEYVNKPDLMIYIKAEISILKMRITDRGRINEKKVDLKFLESLSKKFDEFISSWSVCPVITVDSCKLNFYNDSDLEYMINTIREHQLI